jgi:hypothetical protein
VQKNKKTQTNQNQTDSIYILKLVILLILGSFWLRIVSGSITLPIPVGMLAGILITRTDKFQFDRKIEYAFLLMAMFVGFWLPIGIELVI